MHGTSHTMNSQITVYNSDPQLHDVVSFVSIQNITMSWNKGLTDKDGCDIIKNIKGNGTSPERPNVGQIINK